MIFNIVMLYMGIIVLGIVAGFIIEYDEKTDTIEDKIKDTTLFDLLLWKIIGYSERKKSNIAHRRNIHVTSFKEKNNDKK